MKQLLTTNEIAEKFQVHPHTVREWTRTGKVPAIKISKTNYRYDFDAGMEALKEIK